MKSKVVIFLVLLFIISSPVKAIEEKENSYRINLKQDLLSLMMAYPEYIASIEKADNERIYIVTKSSKKILYDDKLHKSFEGKLNNPDLQDMMEQKYPLEVPTKLMDKDFDPGRIRSYSLLYEVYGCSKEKIEKNLTAVHTKYGSYTFNRCNKASEELKAAINELAPAAERSSKIKAAITPSSGTFNYRVVAGTGRLSPHSFGIAIDLARDKRDYWKWASKEQGEKRLLSYPKEVVEVFEKHNFVWGGKWNHFDILHFEYRPEIILKAKYFGKRNNNLDKWYDGAPLGEEQVKRCVDEIDRVVGS